jgi:hypothetical protein
LIRSWLAQNGGTSGKIVVKDGVGAVDVKAMQV